MDLAFTKDDEAFRAEVRAFLKHSLPPEIARREAQGFHLERKDVAEWQHILYQKGWVAPNWPAEYGGTGWTPIQRYLFELEYGLANAPEISLIALSMVGPVIYRFGSSHLKERFLQPILQGDAWFCQGFSEPQAGSDLASLKTQAIRDGDAYVLNGQKTWTTAAHFADYMICLARTNLQVKPQAGLSMLIVPMDAPGVTVRPIETIDGDHSVNEVFLDNVRVPAEYLIGEENAGWTQAKFLLGNERTHNAYIGILKRYLARIPALIDAEIDNGLTRMTADMLRHKHARLEIDVNALEWSVLRTLASDESPALVAAASGLKVRGSEYLLRASDLENEILGLQTAPRFTPQDSGLLHAGASLAAPGRTTQYLYWRASTIFGGANEIQRNIIWNTMFRA
ncbi:acyl-CoA dehydrogenase family protein [Noviherbaspirillum sedimenti]|uniref:Acyl-CoA dehydrogenase n=1 Tax=Noviherbaspirillum sedimenti TaxID=2320865 RepID=A0A3A3FYP5_9BURK|nr:acyl-CoA dehydrogenase family protein [Noviherbaspirillum sedimenti]RJG01328.1 acyl-CoA dehydrogenase [Noviherbaspirillum sedimenti]